MSRETFNWNYVSVHFILPSSFIWLIFFELKECFWEGVHASENQNMNKF